MPVERQHVPRPRPGHGRPGLHEPLGQGAAARRTARRSRSRRSCASTATRRTRARTSGSTTGRTRPRPTSTAARRPASGCDGTDHQHGAGRDGPADVDAQLGPPRTTSSAGYDRFGCAAWDRSDGQTYFACIFAKGGPKPDRRQRAERVRPVRQRLAGRRPTQTTFSADLGDGFRLSDGWVEIDGTTKAGWSYDLNVTGDTRRYTVDAASLSPGDAHARPGRCATSPAT